MGESIAAYTVSMGKLEGRRNMGNTKVDGRIILKLILEKKNRLDRSGSKYGQVTGSCEFGNEPSSPIKFRKFFE
jgi:hypothetical protein